MGRAVTWEEKMQVPLSWYQILVVKIDPNFLKRLRMDLVRPPLIRLCRIKIERLLIR